MAKQTVNIGVTANDNTGDPLRTAFDKLNDNFDEVYAAGPAGTNIQVSDNTIASTNTNGNIDLDPAGTGKVLVNGPMDANGVVSLNSTVTGNITPTANVTYNIGSDTAAYDEIHGNVLHVGSLILREVGTQLEIFRDDDSTNAILSGNSTTAGSVLNNGNTVVALTQDGPITFYANNYSDGNATVTVINSGNITSPEVVSTGAVTGTSLTDGTATISSGALTGVTTITASGNISGGNVSATGLAGTLSTAAQTNITSVGTLTSLDVTGNVTGGNLVTSADVSTATVTASGAITATGNVAGGNLTTPGVVSATGNVNGGNLVTVGETNTATVTYSGDSTSQTTAYIPSFLAIDSDQSAIQTTFTNILGNSITLNAGKRYEIMAHVILDNDATGNITFGFQESAGDATQIVARMDALNYSGGFADAKQFNTGTQTHTTDMASTTTYHIQFTGTIKTVSATDFGLFANVASGNIIPKEGSSIRIVEYGSDSIGNIA